MAKEKAQEQEQLYRLKAGLFQQGNGSSDRRFVKGDIVSSPDIDLAAEYPEKFEYAPPGSKASPGRAPSAVLLRPQGVGQGPPPQPPGPLERAAAARLQAESTGQTPEGAPVAPASLEGAEWNEEMTVDELKDYADSKEIDLEGAHKKADIVAAIRKSEGG